MNLHSEYVKRDGENTMREVDLNSDEKMPPLSAEQQRQVRADWEEALRREDERAKRENCPTCERHFSGCTCANDALAHKDAMSWPMPTQEEMDEISRNLFG